MGTDQKALEDKFDEENRYINALPEPQRSEYVKNVILSMIEGGKQIMNQPKLQQAKKAQQLMAELNNKATTLVPSLLYTIRGGPITIQCPSCGQEIIIEEPNFVSFYRDLIASLDKELNK